MVTGYQTCVKPLARTHLRRSRSAQQPEAPALQHHVHRCPRCQQGDRLTPGPVPARAPQARRHSQSNPGPGRLQAGGPGPALFHRRQRTYPKLARNSGVLWPTAYRYLHEGLTVLANRVQDLSTASKQDGGSGRAGARHHLRPRHGLIDALNRLAHSLDIPTVTDLDYENADPGFRHPVKKPQGDELTEHHQAFNRGIRNVYGVTNRANALLKVTFKALRRVSLDTATITRTALVLLKLEHCRTT
jgi:DDE superfamily endonuclease